MNRITPQALRQRQPRLVSAKLRASAKGEHCTLQLPCCNHNADTTVLAHLRFFGWAGVAEKPDDYLAVFACSACHDAIDRRSNAAVAQWEFEDLLRALGATLKAHFAAGRLVEGK